MVRRLSHTSKFITSLGVVILFIWFNLIDGEISPLDGILYYLLSAIGVTVIIYGLTFDYRQ